MLTKCSVGALSCYRRLEFRGFRRLMILVSPHIFEDNIYLPLGNLPLCSRLCMVVSNIIIVNINWMVLRKRFTKVLHCQFMLDNFILYLKFWIFHTFYNLMILLCEGLLWDPFRMTYVVLQLGGTLG